MKKVSCFLFALLIVFTSCFVSLPVSAAELRKTVVLDPGHGGTDPGASGNGYDEKDLNWDITIACKEELEKFGITVYLMKPKKVLRKGQKWQKIKMPMFLYQYIIIRLQAAGRQVLKFIIQFTRRKGFLILPLIY